MAWSNWKIALAVVVICGGLAWSQIPRGSQPASSTDRIMTVHENGKAIRCRVVTTWQMENGVLAYQLQALDTGEMLTIVEDGVAAAKQGIKAGSKAKARPMRIFHWGRGKTPPAGTPLPPTIVPASGRVAQPSMSASGEQIVMWEEKAGPVSIPVRPAASAQPIRPVAVEQTVVHQPVSSQEIMCQQPARSYPSPFFKKRNCPPATACETLPGQSNAQVVSLPARPAKEEGEILWVKEIDPATGKVIEGKKPPVTGHGDGQVLWIKEIDPVTGRVIEPAKTAAQASKKSADRWTQRVQTRQSPANSNVACEPTKLPQKTDNRLAQNVQPKPPAANPIAVPPPVKKNEPFTTAAPLNPPAAKKPVAGPLGIPNTAAAKQPTNASPKTQPPSRPAVVASLPPASVSERAKDDILLQPERLAPKGGAMPPVSAAQTNLPPPGSSQSPAPAGQPALPNMTTPGNPQMPGQWPLGAQSVLAAKNGMMNGTTFVPVPVATVPNPLRMPAPPTPKLPEPPAPNAWVNAFTPPPKQQQDQMQMQAIANQQMGVPNMMPVSPYAMQPMANPYMMALGMQGQGYAPYAQPGPMMPMHAQRMPLNYMANYQGPAAPNPVQTQPQYAVMPVQYQQPIQPVYTQPMAPAAAPAQTGPATYLQQLLAVLRESPYPAQREWAAQTMSTFDWRAYPQIVEALIQAARQDPAATVRAGCVYSLSRLGANLEPVNATFQTLRQDADPRVRQEVEHALARTSKQ